MNFIKITEQPSIHEDLEQKSVRELLEGINEEDRKVASAVHACIPQIEKLVNEIVERMHPVSYTHLTLPTILLV